MNKLLEIATNVSTPLSLAAIVVIVLYSIYRQLIVGPLSAQLSGNHTFRVVNSLVRYLFILALVALLVGVGAYLTVQLVPKAKASARLKVVDISFPETAEFPEISIAIRNVGDQMAVLKQSRFTVMSVYKFLGSGHPAALLSSWTYDVKFSVSAKTPYSVSVPLSQAVPPDGADRFNFRLGNDAPPYGDSMGGGPSMYVFYVRLQMIYNEDNLEVQVPDFVVTSSPAVKVVAVTDFPGDDIQYDVNGNPVTISELNKQTALKLANVSAARSPGVSKLINAYSR